MPDPSNPTATFFLSPGRCGTQWITKNLYFNYNQEIDVGAATSFVEGTVELPPRIHEPISTHYNSGLYYRNYDDLDSIFNDLRIKENFDRIESILNKNRSYVEVGWPCFGAIPAFIEKLENVKIVILIRHPVRYAISIAAHNFFKNINDIRVPNLINSNILNKDYDWNNMIFYERALWFWLELYSYSQELREKYPNISFFEVKSEDLFNGSKVKDLCNFLDLEYKEFDLDVYDRYYRNSPIKYWKKIFAYPDIVDLATSLGYELEESFEKELVDRYNP